MILKSKQKIGLSDMVSRPRKPARSKPEVLRRASAAKSAAPDPQPVSPDEPVPTLAARKEKLLQEVWTDESVPPVVFSDPVPVHEESDEIFHKEPAIVAAPQAAINFLEHEQVRPRTARELKSFAVAAILIAAVFQSANIIASSLNARQSVATLATQGFANLKEAQDLTEQNDINGAQDSLEAARRNFMSAQSNLQSLGAFVNSALGLSGKGKSAESALDAGRAVADAGINLAGFYNIANQIKFGAEGITAPDGTYQTLNAALLYLNRVKIDLQKAQNDFDNIDPSILPQDVQAQFAQYAETLKTSLAGVNQIYNGIAFFQAFLGPGQKNILVLFENNNELRPTGGFIGTYGYFKLENGRIVSQKISSIYDLDGQLTDYIAPPGPYQIMTSRWALRDSNYFADYKTSAQKASIFYEKEGMETPDAVLAVTPDVFIDLLKVIGPVDMSAYGLTLNAENFREVVQANTSDSTAKNPKQLLADFAPVLLQKMSALPDGARKNLLPALLSSLGQKNILMYDRNPLVQNKIEAYNWGGRIADSDRDFLAIVNTNIGGKKTDVNIQQKAEIQSEVQADGSIINTLTYTREHNLNSSEADTNIDYVRFLVPYGSELLQAKGFTTKPFQPSDASGLPKTQARYSIDADLQMIDAIAKIDAATGTVMTQEAGKTEFANWIQTGPGETSTVTIKYKLPFKSADSRKYSMIIQKQPGNNPIDLSFALIPKTPVLWYTPLDLKVGSTGLQYHGILNSDLFIGAVLDNQK